MIRQAKTEDAQAIAEIHVTSWQAAYEGLLPDEFLQNLSIERRLQMWQQILEGAQSFTWVAEVDGRLLGFVNCGPSRDKDADPQIVGEIYAIYLLPDAWGQGFGRALCSQALQSLQNAHYQEVMLWVLQDNEGAIYFYERAGFSADGGEKTEHWDDVTLKEVRMRQSLTRP